MAISQNFPSISPSLSLNFASSRTLDPRITFTRTSSATCVGPNGLLRVVPANAPRFDHNPETGESLGLLVEEARTNLLLRSEEFDNAYWTNQDTAPTVTANAEISPRGDLTADRMTFGAASSRRISSNVSVSIGPQYTFSVFAKSVGPTNNKFRLAFFDTAVQHNSSEFVASSSSWQRFSFTFTSAATSSGAFAQIRNNFDSIANDLYFWGAQLEVGAFPTSYIPTTTSTVTRSADVASITGSNFSSWYRQDEGTIFAAYQGREGNSSKRVFTFTDDSFSNNAWLIASNSIGSQANYWQVQAGGVVQAELGSGAYSAVPQLSAAAYRADDFGFSKNGGAPLTDTSGSIPVVNTLRIGAGPANTAILNGTIRQLAYWPTRLSNEILQTLTK
jgi:hypothetical protein